MFFQFKAKLKTFLFRKYLHWFLCLTFLFLFFVFFVSVLVFNVYNTWCIICHLGWIFFLFFFFSYRNVKCIGDRNVINKHLYYYYYYYWFIPARSWSILGSSDYTHGKQDGEETSDLRTSTASDHVVNRAFFVHPWKRHFWCRQLYEQFILRGVRVGVPWGLCFM